MMQRLATWLSGMLILNVVCQRMPDFVVGADNPQGPYLRRWWLIPRNRVLNVYLHEFLRDDDDRALHDHPWPWLSVLLRGSYIEHTIAAGGIHHRTRRTTGSVKLAGPWRAHRVELERKVTRFIANDANEVVGVEDAPLPCWTLFVTGPRMRRWGFHCARQGWIDWARFTRPGAMGEAGPGCDA